MAGYDVLNASNTRTAGVVCQLKLRLVGGGTYGETGSYFVVMITIQKRLLVPERLHKSKNLTRKPLQTSLSIFVTTIAIFN